MPFVTPVVPDASEPERIVLMGMMGSGKTTVGRHLARLLGWRYEDNDDRVRSATGREPAEIRDVDGEDALHAHEADALRAALDEPSPRVIGAAAWVVDDPASAEALQRERGVVWLRARPTTLLARIGSGAGRRTEATDVTWLAQRSAAREERYRAAAELVIDVDDLTAEQVAGTILDWWRQPDSR